MRTPVLGVTGARGGIQSGCLPWESPDEEVYSMIMGSHIRAIPQPRLFISRQPEMAVGHAGGLNMPCTLITTSIATWAMHSWSLEWS